MAQAVTDGGSAYLRSIFSTRLRSSASCCCSSPIRLFFARIAEPAARWETLFGQLAFEEDSGCAPLAYARGSVGGAQRKCDPQSLCENVRNPQPFGWRLEAGANAIHPTQAATRERADKPGVSTQIRQGRIRSVFTPALTRAPPARHTYLQPLGSAASPPGIGPIAFFHNSPYARNPRKIGIFSHFALYSGFPDLLSLN